MFLSDKSVIHFILMNLIHFLYREILNIGTKLKKEANHDD